MASIALVQTTWDPVYSSHFWHALILLQPTDWKMLAMSLVKVIWKLFLSLHLLWKDVIQICWRLIFSYNVYRRTSAVQNSISIGLALYPIIVNLWINRNQSCPFVIFNRIFFQLTPTCVRLCVRSQGTLSTHVRKFQNNLGKNTPEF